MITELKKELETQNNSGTSNPLFVVYDIERIPTTSDYSDLKGWVMNGEEYTDEELKEYLIDNEEAVDDNWKEKAETYDAYEWYYVERPRLQNVFLTRKSAEDFIKQNHYHFSKPYVYVISMWRNYELAELRELIMKGEITQTK